MNAVHLAEQATLGALLLAPDAIPQVAGWLRAGDFTDTWHRDVYSVLLEHSRAHDPLDPSRLATVLTDRRGPRDARVVRIHDLLAATPTHPQPVAYARMVLATAIREHTAALGVLLRAGALAVTVTSEQRRLRSALDLVEATLDDDQARWTTATTGTPPTAATTVAASTVTRQTSAERTAVKGTVAGPVWREAALGADRALTGHDLDPALVRAHERSLIAALALHPERLPEVAAWWRVTTITDPDWRPVYAALLDLTVTDTRVDPVTLVWQVQAGAPRHGPGPGTRAIRDGLDDAALIDPDQAARLVGADLLRRFADHAATTLATSATNPGLGVEDLLTTARLMTHTLAGLATTIPTSTRRAPTRSVEPSRSPTVARRTPPPVPASRRLSVVR